MNRHLIALFLIFTCLNLFSQNQGIISGKVIDYETGFGLRSASINTVLPVCANRPAKLIASVVFPTPPLLLASAIITLNSHTHQVLQDLHSIDDASRIALGRLQAQL